MYDSDFGNNPQKKAILWILQKAGAPLGIYDLREKLKEYLGIIERIELEAILQEMCTDTTIKKVYDERNELYALA